MAKDPNKRQVRDQAGVGPDPRQIRHLTPLGELDNVQIASGEPDIRGWDVWTSTGRELGAVEDLLVDPTLGAVVMLDIDLKGSDRHTVAPIRAAWIDREHKRVVLDAAQLQTDASFPSLARHGEITPEEARQFGQGYARAYGDRGWDQDGEWRVRSADQELRLARNRGAGSQEPAEPRAIESAERDTGADTVADDATDVVVERRQLSDETRATTIADAPGADRPRDVRYAGLADRPVVVEEHIVRRRIVDPSELSADERTRLARGSTEDPPADRRP